MKRVLRLIELMPPIAFAALLWPALAHAYVGPVAAVGFGSATIGLLFAIFSAIGMLLLWPIKALFRFGRRVLGLDSPQSPSTELAEDMSQRAS